MATHHRRIVLPHERSQTARAGRRCEEMNPATTPSAISSLSAHAPRQYQRHREAGLVEGRIGGGDHIGQRDSIARSVAAMEGKHAILLHEAESGPWAAAHELTAAGDMQPPLPGERGSCIDRPTRLPEDIFAAATAFATLL